MKIGKHVAWMGTALVLVVLGPGCSSLRPAQEPDWMFLGAPQADVTPYEGERVATDYATLQALLQEAESLQASNRRLKRRLHTEKRDYFTKEDTEQIALLLRRVMNLRSSLEHVATFYRGTPGATERIQARGTLVGLAAGVTDLSLTAYLVSEWVEDKPLQEYFDASYQRYEVPGRSYHNAFQEITDPDLIKRLKLLAGQVMASLSSDRSPLPPLLSEEPGYEALLDRAQAEYSDLWMRIHYILMSSDVLLPDVANALRHSLPGQWTQDWQHHLEEDAYAVRGLVFKNVSRVKQPMAPLTTFDEAQHQAVAEQLQPGDLLLTYTSGFMSNVFLPGHFKHGITYMGAPVDRLAAGLTNAFLTAFAIDPAQRDKLLEDVQCAETNDGRPADVIEAVAEGVKYSCLRYLMDTHVSRLLVLRPRIKAETRQQQLAGLLVQLGVPYDFEFDFSEASRLCCTELIYRTLEGQEGIRLDFSQIRGVWVLSADDLARYALGPGSDEFDVVFYADPDPDHDDFRARITLGEEAAQLLREQMEIDETQKVETQ